MANHFILFDTAVGRCGIAWDTSTVRAVRLPEGDEATTISRLARACDATRAAVPPAFVRVAIAAITAHLAGEDADLDAIPIDLAHVSSFDREVLAVTRRIARGATRTYGAIATELGDPRAARAVGAALGRNPWPIVVPCHRVTAAGGKLGGFSAPGGRPSKVRLLEIEGALRTDEPGLFDAPDRSARG